MLTLMCILPSTDSDEFWKNILRLIFAFTLSMSVAGGLAASIVYVSKYAGDNLEESVKTVYQIIAYANVTYVMVTAYLKRNDFRAILRRFQEVYDASKMK